MANVAKGMKQDFDNINKKIMQGKKDLMELNDVIAKLRAEKIILIQEVKTALHWITDVRLQMRTQGHGWVDASDSLRIAEKTEYQEIVGWGREMASFPYYIVGVRQAMADNAPLNATYKRNDGTWATK